MRYQTYSTFTDLKRKKEKSENEVNNQELFCKFLGNEIQFFLGGCHFFALNQKQYYSVQASGMQRNSVLGKGKGKKQETGKGEGERTSKREDREDQESRHPGKKEIEREDKEDVKDDDQDEGKVGDRGVHLYKLLLAKFNWINQIFAE